MRHTSWKLSGKRIKRIFGIGIVLAIVLFAIDYAIGSSVTVHTDASATPKHTIGLVLGTAPTVQGRPNLYFEYRLDAAADLYHQGSIQGLLVSGDHGRTEYNEPEAMRQGLIQRGVPNAHITCDYAGFRTLDSVLRAKGVFALQSVTIISQAFHAERAVFLARQSGLDAVAFGARSPSRKSWAKQRVREVLARNLAVVDTLVGTGPKYWGQIERLGWRGE